MQNHPTSSIQVPAPTCGLATSSLVLGICGVILGPLTGIPAVITGHLALGRIKKSGGALKGHGMALAGLILGYIFTVLIVIIAILAAAGFAAGNAAIQKAKRITCLSTATTLEMAVNSFFIEYGSLPTNATSDETVDTATNNVLITVLSGLETTNPPKNPRAIKFLQIKEGKNKKNGMIYSQNGSSLEGLFDPWGGPYKVMLDADYDEKLKVNGEALDNRRVAVWSDGPDRKAGTEDDIKTW